MYITYSIYRSKNNDFIARRRISLPIDGFRQILNLDGLLLSVMKRDVHNIPMIQKFGTAYIGNYQCEQVEITDEDDTDAMNDLAGPDMGGDVNINMPSLDYSPEGEEDQADPSLVEPEPEYEIIDVLMNTKDNSEIRVKVRNLDTGDIEIKPLSEIDV